MMPCIVAPVLMAQKGLYATLYELNYASFDDLPAELTETDRTLAN